MEFQATIAVHGKDNLGITVPDDVVESLGGGKHPKVVVTLGDYSYRTSIARMGGQFLFGINKEHRTKAGVHAEDSVTVRVELDTAPREVTLPSETRDKRVEKTLANLAERKPLR